MPESKLFVKEEKPVLLIVEGKEDELFFKALIGYLKLDNIQVSAVGGKVQMPDNVRVLKNEQKFLDNVLSLGIVRDADMSTDSTFQSICSLLERANLPVPRRLLQPSSGSISVGNPRVSIMIVPVGESFGMLEDICLQSVADDDVIPCVNKYFDCMPKKHESHVIPKAKLQVYLAAKKPELRLGEAAKAGYWNWEHPVFGPMKDFLRQLSAIPQP